METMAAVLSPHDLSSLISMIEAAQTRNAYELRAARVQGGKQRRVSGVVVPLWTGEETKGEESNPSEEKSPRAAESIVHDLEERLESGETYKIQGTTKGGHEVLKTCTIVTTGDTPTEATTNQSTDMGSVAWATLRALTKAPDMAGELARVLAEREKSVLAALEERSEDQYTLGYMQARIKYEPREDAEAVAARWAAIAGIVQMVGTNPDIKEGISKVGSAIGHGFGMGIERIRNKKGGTNGAETT